MESAVSPHTVSTKAGTAVYPGLPGELYKNNRLSITLFSALYKESSMNESYRACGATILWDNSANIIAPALFLLYSYIDKSSLLPCQIP